MNLLLHSPFTIYHSQLKLTGSKSETNRLLLLQALYPQITIENASNSDDSEVMIKALHSPFTIHHSQLINIHHAGTSMRFLTAYFATLPDCDVILTGSSRMQERPIKILVDALNQLGAEITYEENDGFPPIRIKGKKLIKNKVSLPASVSSQYISALLLIAPILENGLELTLEGEITSKPYIKMTLALLNEIGVKTFFNENVIKVNYLQFIPSSGVRGLVESDWSSASYWYSIIALSEMGTQITLSSYKKESLQGDSVLVAIYENFGVTTLFNTDHSITISKIQNPKLETLNLHLNNAPDIAQTIAVTCLGLGIACNLSGLHTLKIKETDRLEALKSELTKLGAEVSITNDSLHLAATQIINPNVSITTYNDHRMAMAFAPLALKTSLNIENAEVVSKSYPAFWHDLTKIGFKINQL